MCNFGTKYVVPAVKWISHAYFMYIRLMIRLLQLKLELVTRSHALIIYAEALILLLNAD